MSEQSERKRPRTQIETMVSCLSCGATSAAFVLAVDGAPGARGTCPKCGNVAYVANIRGLWAFMAAAAEKISRQHMDIFELEAWQEQVLEREAALAKARGQ